MRRPNLYGFVILFKVAGVFLDQLLGYLLMDDLMVVAISSASNMLQNLTTLGAPNLFVFIYSAGVDWAIQYSEPLFWGACRSLLVLLCYRYQIFRRPYLLVLAFPPPPTAGMHVDSVGKGLRSAAEIVGSFVARLFRSRKFALAEELANEEARAAAALREAEGRALGDGQSAHDPKHRKAVTVEPIVELLMVRLERNLAARTPAAAYLHCRPAVYLLQGVTNDIVGRWYILILIYLWIIYRVEIGIPITYVIRQSDM